MVTFSHKSFIQARGMIGNAVAMSQKEYFLIGLAVVLGGLYAIFFVHWSQPRTVAIEHTLRPSREMGGSRGAVISHGATVCFKLPDGKTRINSLRVVSVAELQTNKYPHALWHLVSKNGSKPTDGFAYGFPLAGMTPDLPGSRPEELQPGVTYRLLIQTPTLKGEHDFTLPGVKTEREN
jgi:hypothetical protein